MAGIQAELSVKRLSRARLRDLELLHEAVYGIAPAKNYFPLKYETAYTGAAYIGYVAYNAENMPVAYYGVLPCFMQIDGNLFLAAQSGDTMTHPGYRNKGLFVELANLTYELCREKGIRLIYGFPNQNSEHGLINKLGWITTGNLDRFEISVNAFPLERLARKFAWSRRWYEKFRFRILRKYLVSKDGLPNAAAAEGYGVVDRNEQFLKYKKYSDTQVIQIDAALFWIRLRHELTIGDLQCSAVQFLPSILALKKLTARLGLPAIKFQLSGGTKLHQLFDEHFAARVSFPVCFKDLGSGLPLEKFKFSFADIDIF